MAKCMTCLFESFHALAFDYQPMQVAGSSRALSRDNADDLSQQLSSLQIAQPSSLHVLIQEDCLQHKFSRRAPDGRPHSSDDIVERPERLAAVKLGVAAAYCRLQAATPKKLPSPLADHRQLHLQGSPFDIRFTRASLPLNHETVMFIHNESNLAPGQQDLNDLEPKYPDQLKSWIAKASQAHAEGVSEIPRHLAQGDLYLSEGSKAAIEGSIGCVCEAVEEVCDEGGGVRFCLVRPPGHQSVVLLRVVRYMNDIFAQSCGQSSPCGFCFVFVPRAIT